METSSIVVQIISAVFWGAFMGYSLVKILMFNHKIKELEFKQECLEAKNNHLQSQIERMTNTFRYM